jgi:TolA-binding protein
MKKLSCFFIISILFALVSCSEANKKGSKPKNDTINSEKQTKKMIVQEVDSLQLEKREKINSLHYEFLNTNDLVKANKLIDEYQKYFTEYKSDTLNINFLYNKAVTEFSINKFSEAVSTIDTLLFNYSSKHLRAESMMFKAFIYENRLKQYQKAEKTYQNIIRYFPGTEYAKSAEINLNNLGKTDEELLKELKAKN